MLEKMPIELKGIFHSLLLALVLSLLVAVVVYYSGLKETVLYSSAKLILIISVFSGGCYVSKRYASKGLVHGISLGVLFFTVLLVLSLLLDPSYIDMKTFITTLALCIAAGGAGGILGIGLSDI